jgi:DNA-binding CsgD family transcriptional regulator
MNFEYVSRLLRVITHSQNLDVFCRNTVHNLWPGQRFASANYFTLSQDGTLRKAAGYPTQESDIDPMHISLTSNHSAAQAVRNGGAAIDQKNKSISMPIMRDGWLFGVLVLEPLENLADPVEEGELMALGHALAVYIEGASNGRIRARFEPAVQEQEELTQRQLKILQSMDEGQIYSQIASNLHVSESLVKQEASKIFKFLGVSNRASALKAGRDLLSAMVVPAPPDLARS